MFCTLQLHESISTSLVLAFINFHPLQCKQQKLITPRYNHGTPSYTLPCFFTTATPDPTSCHNPEPIQYIYSQTCRFVGLIPKGSWGEGGCEASMHVPINSNRCSWSPAFHPITASLAGDQITCSSLWSGAYKTM